MKNTLFPPFADFTNLYSMSKTLRFELQPQGKTYDNIVVSGILEEDKHRAESYKKMKKIIDEYHKYIISRDLSECNLKVVSDGKNDSLEEFEEYYTAKNIDNQQKKLDDIQKKLRIQIKKCFKLEDVFKEKLISELLPKSGIIQSNEENELLSEFKGFTTYFTGFHENRKNIYSDEEKATSIAYRLIHENLPKFVDNIYIFEKAMQVDELRNEFATIKSELGIKDNLTDIFSLSYFTKTLTQSQIDFYNYILGGKSEDSIKIKGVNEYINSHNQRNKTNRIPFLKPLFKQILSDKESLSWLPQVFETDKMLLDAIQECYTFLAKDLDKISFALNNIDSYDTSKIYVTNDRSITDISSKLYADWGAINKSIVEEFKVNNPQKKRESDLKYNERITKAIKAIGYFSLSQINQTLFLGGKDVGIDSYFKNLDTLGLIENITTSYADVSDLLNDQSILQKTLIQDKIYVEKIKNLLDAIKELQYFIKPLIVKEFKKDDGFYGVIDPFWEFLSNSFTPLYDKVRNYLTKKIYSEEKIKINFKNSTLLSGWDLNKERDNSSVILYKDNYYYLAIMSKGNNRIFENLPKSKNDSCYQKMVYKQVSGANKMLPKIFISAKEAKEKTPSDILLNYTEGTHKKGSNFVLNDCHKLINHFKESIKSYSGWDVFNFDFSKTDNYNDISEFYKELDHQAYKIDFVDISADYIDSLVEEGKLYLFKIYNKDFSPHSKGTPNMHTLYWKSLFCKENLQDVCYKLNGEAEIFFRKKSIDYDENIQKQGHHYDALKDKFSYPIIKDKRYSVDKFLFHVPITLNFKSKGVNNINSRVLQFIKDGNVEHVIGIDRGERHLLYVTVVDLQGNIKEQFSLNTIKSENYDKPQDYYSSLKKRENERDKARKSWKTIENIKELKEGYMSQVVYKISQLIQKYNAIVAIEDLNSGFMRGRQKIERQIYTKFENRLIDKLSYIVDKKASPLDCGGVLNALQLVNPKSGGKQNGFLFYVPAWNTSKIDPVTGFVDLLKPKYESVKQTKEFIAKFDFIRYNSIADLFEFDVDYSKFNSRADGTRLTWTVCSNGDRIESYRNKDKNSQWDYRKVNLTNEFKVLLNNYGINIDSDIKQAILDASDSSEFFRSFIHLLKLMLQMRNSNPNTEEDYIISPVRSAKGDFYCSTDGDISLPQDADANGAYNIARKGIWAIDQIKTVDSENLKLAITNKEWLSFVQGYDK